MTELSFDGNAALQMAPPPAPDQPSRAEKVEAEKPAGAEKKEPSETAKTAAEPKPGHNWKTVPWMVGTIFVVAAFVVMILISYAQLVIANDEVVSLRSELNQLQAEETQLMAQYELAYDLQEIESQMVSSGKMSKIQGWQTYTLELSEPDSVEYYQGWDIKERVTEFASGLVTAVKEYFASPVS